MCKVGLWKVIILLCLFRVTMIGAEAQTFTTLHSFSGTDGAYPLGVASQTTNGNLYGSTFLGGANGNGTIFEITPGGTFTKLYSFCSQSGCADGELPYGLVQATDGNLYGGASYGGANGYGTIFKVNLSGKLTTLHSFDSTDGAYPVAPLDQVTSGNLYGTTANGGANGSDAGTVFKITPGGTLTSLYSFCSQSGCPDGTHPNAALIQAINGDLYGTTCGAGLEFACNGSGPGTVFKITPGGTLTTVHSFCSQSDCADGEYPTAALVQATNEDLYGTTSQGGADGYGTVYKITPSGTLTTLHSFSGTDGAYPAAGLAYATDGNFYAETYGGGANGYGTVFKITPGGTLTSLYSFCSQSGCADGANPELGGLTQDTNGTFYGTTSGGGANGYGTVFSLSVGLHAFIETVPTSGKVGSAVTILGNNLKGATSVTFNGTPSTISFDSSSEIKTTVPIGATTGKVEVTVSGHTLSSNVKFRVP
ncbi:MAG TPA: choice-of-anchor tandem repeat GloVer-containing protein [Terriglobia bacterium]|nr:choice-of-anchor tandem repeat GloVer-containing protein [Terriglobia bacterium]